MRLHPFVGVAPGAVRLTTRYDEHNVPKAMMGVLHETGHALYEQGLPKAWRYQPVGRVHSMCLHESQSLLIEMQVCRSRAFLEFAAPLMATAFDGRGPAWTAQNLYRHYTRVIPGAIRVDADEVTYSLHIVLRFELERAMLAGELVPADPACDVRRADDLAHAPRRVGDDGVSGEVADAVVDLLEDVVV